MVLCRFINNKVFLILFGGAALCEALKMCYFKYLDTHLHTCVQDVAASAPSSQASSPPDTPQKTKDRSRSVLRSLLFVIVSEEDNTIDVYDKLR